MYRFPFSSRAGVHSRLLTRSVIGNRRAGVVRVGRGADSRLAAARMGSGAGGAGGGGSDVCAVPVDVKLNPAGMPVAHPERRAPRRVILRAVERMAFPFHHHGTSCLVQHPIRQEAPFGQSLRAWSGAAAHCGSRDVSTRGRDRPLGGNGRDASGIPQVAAARVSSFGHTDEEAFCIPEGRKISAKPAWPMRSTVAAEARA
ncbi:hypothetical protein [Aureimonas glaciei]|uniref:hypothetical protein n=1 Tax=Aureimonas glaciei TaxID=1776957 RepID=UPI001668184B|nr:hypothetical protein [Aureimonas glaciei]